MDCIEIRGLEVFARHGALKEEQVLGQKFILSASMYLSVANAGWTDDLAKTVNYAQVAQFMTSYMQEHTFSLIETVAEHLSREVLKQFPLIRSMELTIEKPWAPVGLPLKTVSLTVKRGWHQVYLGIGSNLGEKEANLKRAIHLLQEDSDTNVTKISSFYVTEPVGEVEQDDFLNGALEIETLRSPEELLELIGTIETDLKRVRTVHWGPRTIDVDILLYDQELYHSEALMIPHVEMANRDFVLDPLHEIAPYAWHPVHKKTVHELWCERH